MTSLDYHKIPQILFFHSSGVLKSIMKVPTNFVSGENFLAHERALYWCMCGYEAKFIHTGKFIGLKAYIRKEERSKING